MCVGVDDFVCWVLWCVLVDLRMLSVPASCGVSLVDLPRVHFLCGWLCGCAVRVGSVGTTLIMLNMTPVKWV